MLFRSPAVAPFFKASFSPCAASSCDNGFGCANFALTSAIWVGIETDGKVTLQPENKTAVNAKAKGLKACILQR